MKKKTFRFELFRLFFSYEVTHPTSSTIQIDFPSRFAQRLVLGSSNYSKPRLVQTIESKLDTKVPIRYRSRSGTPVTIIRTASTDSTVGVFPSDFNFDEFYRSSFQPPVNFDEKKIEMTLKIDSIDPDDLQISIENGELIVSHRDRSFCRQILLPSNIDAKTLKIRFRRFGEVFFSVNFFENFDRNE